MAMLQVKRLISMVFAGAVITVIAEGLRRDRDSGSNRNIFEASNRMSPYQMTSPTRSDVEPSAVDAKAATNPAFPGQGLSNRYP